MPTHGRTVSLPSLFHRTPPAPAPRTNGFGSCHDAVIVSVVLETPSIRENNEAGAGVGAVPQPVVNAGAEAGRSVGLAGRVDHRAPSDDKQALDPTPATAKPHRTTLATSISEARRAGDLLAW
jgi:hypothetical protein